MRTKSKNEQEYQPVCALCEYATHLCGNADHYLCTKEGVVSSDNRCRKFSFDPLKRQPMPKPQMASLGEMEELLK